jgi:hypothetical protein
MSLVHVALGIADQIAIILFMFVNVTAMSLSVKPEV